MLRRCSKGHRHKIMDIQSVIQNAAKKLSAQKLDDFEVAGVTESSLVIEAKQQMVENFRRSEGHGVAIRVIREGRLSFASTTDISPKAIDHMIKHAVSALEKIAPSEEAILPLPQEVLAGLNEELGRPFGEISDDEKVRAALTLESAAVAADNRIARVRQPAYEEKIWSLSIISSKGVNVAARRGVVGCELMAIASDEGDSESAYEHNFSPRFESLDVEGTARTAAKRAIAKLGAKPMKAGTHTVLLAPRAATTMVRLAAPSFFADNVQRGKSMLAEKRGVRAYHPDVSIVDDGLLPGGYSSFPFDGEGIPRRRNVLVRDGVIEMWLYDGARAARDGVLSTGSCSRGGVGYLPAIGLSNCFLKAGGHKQEDLVTKAKNGILVTELLGVHTANPVTGDFSLGAEGMTIENGELGRPVRGVTIAGNVHSLFGKVLGVGNDLKFFGSYGAPSLLIEELMLGGS